MRVARPRSLQFNVAAGSAMRRSTASVHRAAGAVAVDWHEEAAPRQLQGLRLPWTAAVKAGGNVPGGAQRIDGVHGLSFT